MTRDECLGAISAAFGGARVEATSNYWNVYIFTEPPREIVLMPSFLDKNVHGNGMAPDELTEHIKAIPDNRWMRQDKGPMFTSL